MDSGWVGGWMDKQMNEQTLQVGTSVGLGHLVLNLGNRRSYVGSSGQLGPTAAPQQLLVESWPTSATASVSGSKLDHAVGCLAQLQPGSWDSERESRHSHLRGIPCADGRPGRELWISLNPSSLGCIRGTFPQWQKTFPDILRTQVRDPDRPLP